ncbi:hypothetical protein CDAR_433841 [Caerostris darwini]|uniref:Uncharacterized protein n=1 Tax=Caerostris darwini TaxID=1538125 RepID=A0AAV4SUJ6_9ARAC|nr:hypothetical protein CDAR_433841 [Caerostris darwini]
MKQKETSRQRTFLLNKKQDFEDSILKRTNKSDDFSINDPGTRPKTCTLFVPPSSTTALSIFDPENSYEPPQHLNYNAFMNPPPFAKKRKKAFLQQNILRRPYFYHFFQMKKPSLVKSIAKRAITSPVFYFKQPPFHLPLHEKGGYEYQRGREKQGLVALPIP